MQGLSFTFIPCSNFKACTESMQFCKCGLSDVTKGTETCLIPLLDSQCKPTHGHLVFIHFQTHIEGDKGRFKISKLFSGDLEKIFLDDIVQVLPTGIQEKKKRFKKLDL